MCSYFHISFFCSRFAVLDSRLRNPRMHASTHAHTHIYAHTCIHARTYVHIYILTCTHTRARTRCLQTCKVEHVLSGHSRRSQKCPFKTYRCPLRTGGRFTDWPLDGKHKIFYLNINIGLNVNRIFTCVKLIHDMENNVVKYLLWQNLQYWWNEADFFSLW